MKLTIYTVNTAGALHQCREFTVPMPRILPRAGELVEIAKDVFYPVEEVQWDIGFEPTLIFRGKFSANDWKTILLSTPQEEGK